MHTLKASFVVGVVVVAGVVGSAVASSASSVQRVHGFQQFKSPSGNIGCELDKSFARCDVEHHDWKPGPTPANCHLDYGQGVQVSKHGKGSLVCAGDTALDPKAPKLLYGHSLDVGPMKCVSKTTGMTCKNKATGHGFFVSKESYRVF